MHNKEPLTKAQYIERKFHEFINDKNLGDQLVGEAYYDAFELFDAYISDTRVADAIDTGNYSALEGFGSVSINQLVRLGPDRIRQIVDYIHDYINVDKLRVKD